ncbi:MAG: tetratricopeptide repeat protein [Candidatus Cloacimonetes bacterium]|nr:tetratricopeptide repeat protein [Candidatus Cloacimonadota bacterium]MCF7814694.1 tetratricopeptide repeat protein [Candidatus Cloacimonadota bacterium]MCF7884580.1 tetratricopeptide repeat protein [Candidatus Cloacimonadota bacterium]
MERYLIPEVILKNELEKKYFGSFEKVVLFIDIAGFTPLSERLMENGTAGAEALSEIINKTLGNCVKLVYKYDGFVANFAGDAFWALFPTSQIELTLSAAKHISDLFVRNKLLKTPFGNFDLSFRGGLSIGRINWKIIDNEYKKNYYFPGKPINNSFKCHQIARIGEIVLDKALIDSTETSGFANKINQKYYSLQIGKVNLIKPKNLKFTKQLDQQNFVSKNVLELKEIGEFRSIVSCFITLKINKDLDKNISLLLDNCQEFGAYFKDVIILGKLAHILVYFGTPSALENVFQKAADFALKSIKMQKQNIKIGMSFGTVFSGFIDTEFRSEFLAIGKKVNLASRLNSLAEWSQILIDKELKKFAENRYECLFAGKQKLKGFSEPTDIFQLQSKINMQSAKHLLVGREKEIEILTSAIKKLDNGEFGGIINIVGEAGIGKSFLIDNIQMKNGVNFKWFTLVCNELIDAPMNPFEYFMQNYFEQSPENAIQQNKYNFDKKIHDLVCKSKDKDAAEELHRTCSYLAATIGIHWNDSLLSQLGTSKGHKNFISSFIAFLRCEASQKPLVLRLEDAHWLDDISYNILKNIIPKITELPIMIVSSSRILQNGSYFSFSVEKIAEMNINLKVFGKENTRKIIQSILKNRISNKIIELIINRCNGNPFFIEQFVNYLKENGFLKLSDAEYSLDSQIKNNNIEIPQTINSIIMARIDRLSAELKTVVKNASILGREFAVEILTAMLRNNEIDKILFDGEKKEIWHSISKLVYIFKHSLIRESVYNMQLKKQLRKLHQYAAEAIETIYSDNLENHYEDLVYHFEKAEIEDRMLFYLEKAAINSGINNFHNKSIELCKKYILLTKDKQQYIEGHGRVQLHLGQTHEQIGKIEEAKEICETIIGNPNSDFETMGYGYTYLGMLLYRSMKYEEGLRYLFKAEPYFEKIKNWHGLAVLNGDFAVIYLKMGKFEEAMAYFDKQLKICKKHNLKNDRITANVNLGVLYIQKKQHEKALKHLYIVVKEAKTLKKFKFRFLEAAYINIGSVFHYKGNYKKAIEYFKEGLKLCKITQNLFLKSLLLEKCGRVYFNKRNYNVSQEYFNQKLIVANKGNYKHHQSVCYEFLGKISFQRKKYQNALKFYKKELQLLKEMKNQNLSRVYFRMALTFSKLKKYEEALEYLAKSSQENSQKDLKESCEIIYQKALIYRKMRRKSLEKTTIDELLKFAESNSILDFVNLAIAEQNYFKFRTMKNFTQRRSYFKITKKIPLDFENKDIEKKVVTIVKRMENVLQRMQNNGN